MPDASQRPAVHLAVETTEPTSFGHGFISGLLRAILGIAGFGLVLSLRVPSILMQDDLRPLHTWVSLGAVLHLILVASFLLGSVSEVPRGWIRQLLHPIRPEERRGPQPKL